MASCIYANATDQLAASHKHPDDDGAGEKGQPGGCQPQKHRTVKNPGQSNSGKSGNIGTMMRADRSPYLQLSVLLSTEAGGRWWPWPLLRDGRGRCFLPSVMRGCEASYSCSRGSVLASAVTWGHDSSRLYGSGQNRRGCGKRRPGLLFRSDADARTFSS